MIVKLILAGQAGDGWLPTEDDLSRYVAQLAEVAEAGTLPLAAAQLRVCRILAQAWPQLPERDQRWHALRLVAHGKWAGTGDDLARVVRHLTGQP